MSIIEDWYSLDGESKKVEELQKHVERCSSEVEELQKHVERCSSEIQDLKTTIGKLVEELKGQQSSQIQLLEEMKILRTTVAESDHVKQTKVLLEELKIIKQRELNLLLREKIPIPFFASTETLLTKKILL